MYTGICTDELLLCIQVFVLMSCKAQSYNKL